MSAGVATAWECRPTVGNDNNGGGFDSGVASPGTDFSQQDATQKAYTDLVAATTTTITSAARPFSSVDPGNFIQILSGTGWTAGFYEILSVSGVTATVDRAIATAASTGGTGNLGGALNSPRIIITRGTYNPEPITSANIVYLKATGSLVLTTTMTCNVAGNMAFKLIGYTTTRGDNGRAAITTATNSIPLFTISNGGAALGLFNLSLTNTAGTRAAGITLSTSGSIYYLIVQNCLFDGFLYSVDGGFEFVFAATVYHGTFIDVEIKNSTVHGMRLYDAGSLRFVGCYIHDNTGDGIHCSGAPGVPGGLTFVNCVIRANSAAGVWNKGDNAGTVAKDLAFHNCAVIDNAGDGIKCADAGGTAAFAMQLSLFNTIIDSNGGYGVKCDAVPPATGMTIQLGKNNAFRGNTSGARLNFATLPGDIVLTADPFTGRTTGDFTLNGTAGGGAACKAAGYESGLF